MSEEDNPKVVEGNPQLKVTRLAREGLDFATLFTAKFMRENVNGHQPVMREPQGVSTEGGRQAVQHIVLEPKDPSGSVITIGQANIVTKAARVRTYACLQRMHQMRYRGTPFVLSNRSYQEFFDKMIEFMKKHGLTIEIESQPPDVTSIPPPAMRAQGSSGSAFAWVVLLLLLAAAAAGGYLVFSGKL